MQPTAHNPDLALIAARLEGLEETIIFKLLDRAQFCLNAVVYEKGKSGFFGEDDRSLFEQRLLMQEQMDAQFGRFQVPEERPFSKDLPAPRRTVNLPDTGLAFANFDAVNLCGRIRPAYSGLLPRLCPEGNDGQFGSSVEHDVYALQAIARRVHYGALYVAESKFRSDPEKFQQLIDKKDKAVLLAALTRREVEDAVIARVREKVASAQAHVNNLVRHMIDPAVLVGFYRDAIIPLTKEGEVLYLLSRRRDTES
jgi:chorismate mutase